MIVVTGTGRSGTSLIAKWLNELGLLEYEANWVDQFNAGLEPTDVSRVNGAIWIGNDPEYQNLSVQKEAIEKVNYSILKDPKFFYGNVLDTWLSVRQDLKFVICLRDFNAVYKSRLRVKQLAMARKPEELRYDLGRFLSQLIFKNIPFEIIKFPDFIDSYDDVYNAFKSINSDNEIELDYKKGKKAWEKIIDKTAVHF